MAKTDARVRYTKRVLKRSLLKLLQEKPINKITVKEVCELAELNRATFYTHYSDCFDLLESIQQELLDAFAASLQCARPFDVTALIEGIYRMILEHDEACRVLIFRGACSSVSDRMIALAHEPTITAWRRELPHATDAELEMLYAHLSCGLMHVVISGYDKYPREDIIRFVNRVLQGSLALYQ